MPTFSQVKITFNKDIQIGDKLNILSWNTNGLTTRVFTWVSSRVFANTVTVGTPTSNIGETSAINFKTAFDLVAKKEIFKNPYLSVNELHMLGEVLEKSFRGRGLLGDPDYNKIPAEHLLSEKYLKNLWELKIFLRNVNYKMLLEKCQ